MHGELCAWPVSSRQSEVVQHGLSEQADPLSKPGIIGAFCRAYGIADAISAFLPDIYEPSAMEGRFDYIPADSAAGVVVYDDKFVYSHHATDPVCGRLLNAFDLIRLHRFRNLDDKYPEDTPITKLPSYKAMTDFASKDENVKLLLVQERQSRATDDFSVTTEDLDWQKHLEYEPRSTMLKNSLHNITLILQHDPNLKALVFNQQLDGMEIKGSVPWKHPSKYWRDADDAQLISYVDSNYGTFSQRNYQIAVAKVTDDRSYHPIREFLDALPEWDKSPRVDMLLINYLGAEDNAYVRAVTRKTLCAAISRVLHPGCKFDSMLVLNGPQGVGKSTLISKLAGEWFSDSLNLSDTKDKTAAEKLQGYWILEIGELAGLRKAEVETLRSFLSRQNDIYRAAFGKRAIPHLRQCIFFGTTNADSGYLRDTTGNRRFWPVKTPGDGRKHSWELSTEDTQQIWAEALEYVNAGEKL
nr:virulence-associated E family protein [Dehalococcoides mccartyi]